MTILYTNRRKNKMGRTLEHDDVYVVTPMEHEFIATPLEGEFVNREIQVYRCVDNRENTNQYDDLESKVIWFIHAAAKDEHPEGFLERFVPFFRKTLHEFKFVFAYTQEEAEEIYWSAFGWKYAYVISCIVPCILKQDPYSIDRMFDSYFCEAAMYHGEWDEVEEFDDETIDRAAISLAARESLYK